ncbi:hypothetical protein ACS04_34485 [Streptomyces roseus]|uniref:Uncharacterized protein n=1 Tax=Streptomyces roseus TaxID=66430 RepID=A0A0J6XFI2_9ACTN|nr:hypothetical protein ACS04_34485 [Streptomyces roseus]
MQIESCAPHTGVYAIPQTAPVATRPSQEAPSSATLPAEGPHEIAQFCERLVPMLVSGRG